MFEQKQPIKLQLSDHNYVIEKVNFGPITKSKVKLFVGEGTVALINGVTYPESPLGYDLNLLEITSKKGEQGIAYLYKKNFFNSISIRRIAGSYDLRINGVDSVRGKYPLIYNAIIELSDYKLLVEDFGRTVTKDELENIIIKDLSNYIQGAFETVANKYITENTTDIEFKAHFDDIKSEVIKNKEVTSILMNKGLFLNSKNLNLELGRNSVTEELKDQINKEKLKIGINKLHSEEQQNDILEKDKMRQHEIDRIKAENTKVVENTINIHTNGDIKTVDPVKTKSFCHKCGEKITIENALFCPYCGTRL